jgi:tetratricopeptide (TPR) repeat protein
VTILHYVLKVCNESDFDSGATWTTRVAPFTTQFREDRWQRPGHTRDVTSANEDWEKRISELWAAIDEHDEDEFVALIDRMAAELPPENAIGLFERAAALDSTGHSDLAIPLYKAALDAGLVTVRRRRAVIQMASSLRNIGKPQDAVALLTAELDGEADALTGAVRAFLALALADVGREREAVGVALTALSQYLPRYNRSVARYAQEFTAE